VQRERAFDRSDLAPPARVVEARASAGHGIDRGAREDGRQGARRGRVADTHLADGEQVDPVGPKVGDDAAPDIDGLEGLGAGHRRLDGHVAGAGADPRLDQRSAVARAGRVEPRDRPRDPDVDDEQSSPDGARERVHRRATGDEVRDHLGRHLRPG
jgi:hypothetical protein